MGFDAQNLRLPGYRRSRGGRHRQIASAQSSAADLETDSRNGFAAAGKIENVLGYATASRFRLGDNPARWRGHLKTLLGGAQKEVEHHAALPFPEAPTFAAELRERQSTSAQGLELLS